MECVIVHYIKTKQAFSKYLTTYPDAHGDRKGLQGERQRTTQAMANSTTAYASNVEDKVIWHHTATQQDTTRQDLDNKDNTAHGAGERHREVKRKGQFHRAS